jgi:SRSO17 transposase
MVVRYEDRFRQMMDQAEVSPDAMQGLLDRLESFAEPFAASMGPTERRRAAEYLAGLLSHLEHKTAEGIAYLLDQDRQPMQRFIGQADWDHRPPLTILVAQVGERLGEPDGVIVFDPSAFAKKGDKSVGVARQWCGRLGKVENCQVGIYMGYVSRIEHALVDFRLFLPEEWTKHRARCRAAGIPREVRAQTRHELALEMLTAGGPSLPHAWVAGDDEMGRPEWFRRALRDRGERYLLAVPSNTLIRDREAAPPEHHGRGRPRKNPFERVDAWAGRLAEGAWTRIEVRDGEKGPLVVEAVKWGVRARTETGGEGPDELLFITRELQSDHTYKLDYHLSCAAAEVPLAELARVAKAEHRIEECLGRAKGEAGLADYQVRNWPGWHRHQTLALLAAWFLTEETRRGKNPDPGADVAATEAVDRGADRGPAGRQRPEQAMPPRHPLVAPKRAGAVLLPSFA